MKLTRLIKRLLHPDEPPSESLLRMREAIKTFWAYKFPYVIDRGELDGVMRHFQAGDTITIHVEIKLIANDILFMNALAGKEITEECLRKVHEMWDEED